MSGSATRVLLIDDDAKLYELLRTYLSEHGFSVARSSDGATGLAELGRQLYDVVLLDLMMPGVSGLEVCRRIRQTSRIPIVMLTAKGDEADRVVGLELGADDYVAKPFSPRELVARIRAVLRRSQPDGDELRIGDLEVDIGGRTARRGGVLLELTGIELDLLVALVKRAGRVVTREALLEAAGRSGVAVGERTVDVHVSHLRQKLGDDPRAPQRIKTVRGVGYVFTKE